MTMLFRLALRNVWKSLPKRFAFGAFFAATMALLFLGNTLFENSDRGLSSTYVQSFTGQASLSAPSPEQFTIFGSDLPLIGEYLVLPLLTDSEGLRATIASALPRARFLPQVSAAGVLAIDNYSQNVPVFGVDFRAYFAFFPALKLVAGTLPEATTPSLVLTKPQADKIAEKLGRSLDVGDKLTLSFAVGTSFVIREVTLAALYEYPADDALLSRIVLTDPDTARALNGYLYGTAEAPVLDESSRALIDSAIGDLFAGAEDTTVSNSSGLSSSALAKALSDEPAPVVGPGTVEGAWNFILVEQDGASDAQLLDGLRKAFPQSNLQIRDWRETAGGTAQIAWFLRIIFDLGLLFIALVSCLILINSLSLSILERTREIGTMRALGAERGFVGGLIAWETLILVAGTGVVGVAVGCLATVGLNAAHLRLENVYIASLFGSTTLHLTLSWSGVIEHLILGLVLGMAAVLFPVRKALAIQPVKAIARDQ